MLSEAVYALHLSQWAIPCYVCMCNYFYVTFDFVWEVAWYMEI